MGGHSAGGQFNAVAPAGDWKLQIAYWKLENYIID
jgi:hypothetical protein